MSRPLRFFMNTFYQVTTYLDDDINAETRLWQLIDRRKAEFPVEERPLYLRLELRDTNSGKVHKRSA